jgi:hypothetical protein
MRGRRQLRPLIALCAVGAALALVACGSKSTNSTSTSGGSSTTAKAQKGGAMTVLEDSAFAGRRGSTPRPTRTAPPTSRT